MINFKEIKLLILDCDGILTDGKIIYDNNFIETKNFSCYDGLAIQIVRHTNLKLAVITGRKSHCLEQRCKELGIELLYQGVKNKLVQSETLLTQLGLTWSETAYMGDDWNDYPAMKNAALKICPNNSFPNFKTHCDYVTERNGGDGAVREAIEYIFTKQELYEEILEKFLQHLVD